MALVNGLVRPTNDRMIAGVCSGIARYLKVDTGLVRAVLIIAVAFAGLGIWVYPLAWLLMPSEDSDRAGIDTLLDQGRQYMADQKARRDASQNGRPAEVFDPYREDDRR